MSRFILFILVVFAGFFAGRHWPASVSAPSATSSTDAGEAASREPAASHAATSHAAASGLPTTVLRPQDVALRTRALGGDGRAAAELHDLDETCRALQLRGELRPESLGAWRMQPPAVRRDSHFAQITAAELAVLRDDLAPAETRERLGREIVARLRQLCAGYGPLPAADRYAVALAAANADRDSFWEFVYEPPFSGDVQSRDGGDDAQLAREREWAERIPRELRRRADAGDADAALALALAYSRGYDDDSGGGIFAYPLLNGAIDDDPVQAYRWFLRFLELQPTGPYSPQARRIADRIGASLDAAQRAEVGLALPPSSGAR